MTNAEIQEVFTYHAPDQYQVVNYGLLREQAKELALLINKLCPESREKSLALTHLQIVMMMSNASIAIHSEG